MAPVVDEALAGLSAGDRAAILLRYVEGRSFREVSVSLGVSEDAAKKRVTRALDRLRLMLEGHGVSVSVSILGVALAGQLATAAPGPLVDTLSRGALAASASASAGSATASALVSETISAWRWLRWRWIGGLTAAVVLTGAAVLKLSFGTDDTASDPGRGASVGAAAVDANAGSPAAFLPPDINSQANQFSLRVVDAESGVPVSKARVVLSVWSRTEPSSRRPGDFLTDEQGVCVMSYVRGTERLDVGVMQAGYAARYATWPSEGHSGIPPAYTLRLPRVTNALGGVVLDAGGRPLAGAAPPRAVTFALMAQVGNLDFKAFIEGRKGERAGGRDGSGHAYAYASDKNTRVAFDKLKPVELAVTAAVRMFKAIGKTSSSATPSRSDRTSSRASTTSPCSAQRRSRSRRPPCTSPTAR